jgi:UPF0755 protein
VFRFFRALFLVFSVLAVVATGMVMLFSAEIRRPAGSDDTPVEFVIEPGEATSSIATRLASQGLVRQPLLFVALTRWQGLDGTLQAGNYLLRQNMTMNDILVALQQGVIVKEVQITIIRRTPQRRRSHRTCRISGRRPLPRGSYLFDRYPSWRNS